MFLFPAFADELPAYTAARRAAWSGDDAGVIAATEGLAGASEDARRANLLRAAALLARGDDRGAGSAWREVVQHWPQDALSDAAYLEIATVYLSRGRTTEADVYARRVGPGPARGQALAVRAHVHLLDGERGRGLGALVGAGGASPWFEPGFREAAEVLLARRHAKAVVHLDAAAAILGGNVRLPDGGPGRVGRVSGWPDTWGTIPIDDTFNGELCADELDRYRFTVKSRCPKE